MEIESVNALLKQHVYEQSLDLHESELSVAKDGASDSNGHTNAWDNAPQRPQTTREPFSPPTMGYPLPYLDVMTIQSKRLLPVTRKELDAQRRQAFEPRRNLILSPSSESGHADPNVDEDAADDDRNDEADRDTEDADAASLPASTIKPASSLTGVDTAPVDFDAILRNVRLLVEPIAIPDLSHTGVKWQLAQTGPTRDSKPQKLCVTVPNHSFDETQVKLFYPSGAKNTNMREYIKDTIQKHMIGILTRGSENDELPTKSPMKPSRDHTLAGSQSMPVLRGDETGSSPAKAKKKHTTKRGKASPTKVVVSPSKRAGVSSGARLSGAVSTSGLLNPELTRQAKDILAQLRANANKVNDLIG